MGTMLSFISEALFISLLFFLAGGYTITRRKFPLKGRVRLATFLTIYFTIALTLTSWDAFESWEYPPSHPFDSALGVLLLVLYTIIGLRFRRFCNITVAQFGLKVGFYKKFKRWFTLFLLRWPIIVVFAGIVLVPMDMSRGIMVVEGLVLVIAQAAMLMLYHPNVHHSIFTLEIFPSHSTLFILCIM